MGGCGFCRQPLSLGTKKYPPKILFFFLKPKNAAGKYHQTNGCDDWWRGVMGGVGFCWQLSPKCQEIPPKNTFSSSQKIPPNKAGKCW